MGLNIVSSGQACGAAVRGVDLRQPLTAEVVKAIEAIWLEHHVLAFPEQQLSDADLLRFTQYFGPLGDDPFIKSIPGNDHVIAIQRRANETSSLFAENWHTDWSFQARPPRGTCLFGLTIPPHGGNTLFANQQKALRDMPAALRAKIEGQWAIHSAAGGYAPDGLYGQADARSDRSMQVQASEQAYATQRHPLIRKHPQSGEASLFGCLGYIIGIEGMAQSEAYALLSELHQWQTREEFVYSHPWQEGMLVMWDNRSVLHRATGGYEGYDRLLHRTTIGSPHEPA